MYTHLMVPVDDTLLSSANVNSAVKLAKALRARITFFHATSDFSATDDGALMRAIAPATFADAVMGDTNVLLLKAESVAMANGVPCETASAVSDHPAESIVEAARSRGCDVIVMASRGNRGVIRWLHSSRMEKVLQQAGIPLVVTRFAAAQPFTACERAVAVIQDEHQSMTVVARGLQNWSRQAQVPATMDDLESLELMLSYVQSFPLQHHHPKEERHLHGCLRQRHPDSDSLLREVESEHALQGNAIERVAALLHEVKFGQPKSTGQLIAQVRALADAALQHIRREEELVLPLAKEHLNGEDWTDLADAYDAAAGNQGPSEQPGKPFAELVARIANRTAGFRLAA